MARINISEFGMDNAFGVISENPKKIFRDIREYALLLSAMSLHCVSLAWCPLYPILCRLSPT
jgi:hypothetical protein